MAMKYICLFHDYREKFRALTDRQVGKIIRAALTYADTGEILPLPTIEDFVFAIIKGDIDRQKAEYERRCEKNKANALKRWQNDAIVCEECQEEEKDKEKEKDKYKDEREEKEKTGACGSCPTSRPDPKEVREYCIERRSTVSAEVFMNFYDANGWVQSGGRPIVDWKAALRAWENRDRQNGIYAPSKDNAPIIDDVELPF